MAKTYFTNLTEIKKNTLLDANLSDKVLLIMLTEAQNRYLQQVIGTNTYKDLQNKIMTNSLNAIERTLIEDYIVDYLFVTIEMIATIDLISKFTNGGANRDNANFNVNTTLDELRTIRVSHEANQSFNGGLIIDYIMANIDSFPLYIVSGDFVKPITAENHGFVIFDSDLVEDEQYYIRRAGNRFEEGI